MSEDKPAASIIVPVHKQPPPDHPNRSCATCDRSFFPTNPANGQQQDGGQCRIDPPKAFCFPMPPAVQGGPVREFTVSVWPIVFKNQCCATGYARKPELTQ